jgi:hypothetical protein
VFDLRQLGVKKSNAAKEPSQMAALIRNLEAPLFAGSDNGQSWISSNAKDKADFASGQYLPVTAFAAPMPVSSLGDNSFCKTYGTKAAFYAGAMANGIASKEMVTALGSAGYMGSFGSAGLALQTVEEAVKDLSARLPDKPWAINLIHSPNEPEMEKALVDMYLKYGVRTIEAAAFMALTPSVVRYRAAGLSSNPDGSICIANRIIAKISRRLFCQIRVLERVEKVPGLLNACVFVNYRAQGPHHCNRMLMLPDVSAQIHPFCSALHSIVYKLYHALVFNLGASGHDDRNRAAVHHLIEVFAPVGFNHPCSKLGCNSATQGQITGIALFKLLAHSGYGHYGNAVILALIDQLGQIHERLALIVRAHKNGNPRSRCVKADNFGYGGCYFLIGKIRTDNA